MRTILKWVTVAAIAALMLATASPATGAAAGHDQRRFHATTLSGAEEIPGPGDPDGEGFAAILLKPQQETVCFYLAVRDIAPAAASHIHRGPAGVAGPVVVGLSPPPTDGSSFGCVTADPALIREIIATPDQFYVNVHNADFPAGAVRGQLG